MRVQGRVLPRAGGCYRESVALAALVLSILALLVSALAYWRQVKWARIAGRAQVRIAASEGERPTTALLERRRAALSVEFEPVGTGGHMLVVRTEGPATAHGVTIDLAPRAAPLGRRWPLRSGVAPELLNSPFPATICPRAKASVLLNENLATVTQLRGTLNNPQDRDQGWTVEGRIRWRDFTPTGGRPAAGDQWKFALCRYDYSVDFEGPELSCSAPLTRSDFHHFEDYATLQFFGPDQKE